MSLKKVITSEIPILDLNFRSDDFLFAHSIFRKLKVLYAAQDFDFSGQDLKRNPSDICLLFHTGLFVVLFVYSAVVYIFICL